MEEVSHVLSGSLYVYIYNALLLLTADETVLKAVYSSIVKVSPGR